MSEAGDTRTMSQIQHITANVAAAPRREQFDGREHIVVPVVMARADTEMNDGVIPAEEMDAASWNGTPVTIGHPEANGGYISANSPQVLERWAVGRLFNAEVADLEGVAGLRAEAWIDVERAGEELIAQLESDVTGLDVSTGYISLLEDGFYRNIKPDHLALLPNEQGACSWEDGCGVRANRRGLFTHAVDALKRAFNMADEKATQTTNKGCSCSNDETTANRRGSSDDKMQMIADLISNDGSPFVGEDQCAMEGMSYDTLKAAYNDYCVAKAKDYENGAGPDSTGGNEESAAMADDKQHAQQEQAALTDEDRAALQYAHRVHADHRAALVKRITTNSAMTVEALEDFDTAKLETIADGLRTQSGAADFSGRAPARTSNTDQADEADAAAVEAMTPPSTAELIANRRKAH